MTKILHFSSKLATQDAAQLIFEFLGISDFEERDSSNYPPEDSYFMGRIEDMIVKIYAIDYSDSAIHSISIESNQPINESLIKGLFQFFEQKKWNPSIR